MKSFYWKRWFCVLLIAAFLAPAGQVLAAPVSPAGGAVPRFEPGPCTFKPVLGLREGVDVTCGNLIVPEQYAKPDGPTLTLGVAIIKSTSASPRPDPVVFAQGGPGGSTIDTYTQLLPSSRIRRNRDLVLFDQRGTMYSKPNLFCQEMYDLTINTLDQVMTAAESEKAQYTAAMACRERLVKEGVNLTAYNSVDNANDIESLRKALGYQQINLYGVSYGTLLALHAMRQNPSGLRSVIIDSVVPPTVNFNFESARSEDRAFTELFKACKEDAACDRDYPNLEKTFFDLVDRLNKTPATIQLTDSDTHKTYKTVLNGDSLVSILFQLLYAHEFIPLLPKMIHNVAAGHYAFLEGIMPLFIFDKSVSYGMYFSVVCAEGGTSDPTAVSLDGIRPELSKDVPTNNAGLVKLCTDWKVPALPAKEDAAVVSDIPTLVFNGRFDPITPPAYGQEAARTLSKSYLFIFPNTGHGALTTSDCADGIFLEFLANPNQKPDSSCIDSLPPVQFVTSNEVIDIGAAFPTMMALNDLLGKSKVPTDWVLFGGLLLGLLSACVVFPLAWLVRIARRKPARETPALMHLAPWISVMEGGTLLAFVAVFIAILFEVAIAEGSAYFFGIPAHNRTVLILPLMALLLTIVQLVYTFLGWFGNYWSLARKIYFTLLSLCAVGLMIMLGVGGFLTSIFN